MIRKIILISSFLFLFVILVKFFWKVEMLRNLLLKKINRKKKSGSVVCQCKYLVCPANVYHKKVLSFQRTAVSSFVGRIN